MNLSDPSDNDSSSDENPIPSKRPRADTYGASSTTSHGSAAPYSDEELSEVPNAAHEKGNQNTYEFSTGREIRLSKSSMSENCSSHEDDDDFRRGFDDNQADSGEVLMQTRNDFYSNNLDKTKPQDDKTHSGEYSSMAQKMMSNMGYKPGRGLGKNEHGRVDPVEASTQKGRRGLGLQPSTVGSLPKDYKWSPDETVAQAEEEVLWMPTPPEEPLSGDLLEEWLKKGPKKLTIDDETEFVKPEILKGILQSKTIFDSLDDKDLREARFRSNPYEKIGSVIFLNRAAVKMANIDAVFDFMFTKPKNRDGTPAVDNTKEILYFADVCAGPGGFSEYVLYRRGWKAKGFGFTLKGPCDFKLMDFYAGTPETFNTYYGVNNDGNIFDPANLDSLKDHVLKHTEDKGVHFLMADGGFSVEGQENIQEILSKQLYLCQCLAALMLVRTGGHFVVKLFDVFTMFSVGLIYIMYRCFDRVSIHKPVTSRPANSERYLVCKGKRLGAEAAERHLFTVNSILWSKVDDDDVTELVPLDVIQEDAQFYEYIHRSNCMIGENQIQNLLKIAAFSKDRMLKDASQSTMREECLKLWKIPDEVRTQPERLQPDDCLMIVVSLMKCSPPDSDNPRLFKSRILNRTPTCLLSKPELNTIKSAYAWNFVVLSSDVKSRDLKFLLGCGGKQVYQLEGDKWQIASELNIMLPARTLIYGELVKEFKREGANQMHTKALHIVDAVVLGGVDISHLTLTERLNQCNLFCQALEKKDMLPIRCKRLFNLENFSSAMNKLYYKAMKRVKKAVVLDVPMRNNREDLYYAVGSILLMKEVKDPWSVEMSKKFGVKYYFNKMDNSSVYQLKPEARMDAISAFTSRIQWPWEDPIAVYDGQLRNGISRLDMEEYVRQITGTCNKR